MSKVIGIDLGTVNSCVAILEDGRPKVIPDENGNHTTPSIFAMTASGNPLAGYEAQKLLNQDRFNTVFAVKRLIGLKFDSEEVRLASKKLPYKIIPAPNGDAWVEINGVPTSPEEISSHILARLKEYAEVYLGERVTQAVVTVPAHFNDSQRQATRDAARIAGLDVLRILNEPTAAALAYGLSAIESAQSTTRRVGRKQIEADRIVAVFDLGGGTFDVSILALRSGVFDVLATNGDTYLGGEDFDLMIVGYVVSEFRRTTGKDLSTNKELLQRLKLLARDAKHTLSERSQAVIHIPYATHEHNLDIVLERRTFEMVVQPVMKRLAAPSTSALQDAGLVPADIDDVILVGGMTRIPAVKKFCRLTFGREPIDTVDPDEAVALGAAVQAGLLQGLLKGVSLQDVTSLSLGIETQGGLVQSLIPRNTNVPVKVSDTFTTSSPNQQSVSIHLVQGESNFAPENISLGRFDLAGIRTAPRGEPKIEVSLEVDSDGIVHISACDLETGEAKALDIIASSGLNDSEIDELLRKNATVHRHRQRTQRDRDELTTEDTLTDDLEIARNALRSAIFMTQFRLDKEGQKFRGPARTSLEACLLSSREVLETSNDLVQLQNNLDALNTVTEVFEKFLDAA